MGAYQPDQLACVQGNVYYVDFGMSKDSSEEPVHDPGKLTRSQQTTLGNLVIEFTQEMRTGQVNMQNIDSIIDMATLDIAAENLHRSSQLPEAVIAELQKIDLALAMSEEERATAVRLADITLRATIPGYNPCPEPTTDDWVA